MKLVFNCKKCNYINTINQDSNDRVELSKEIGSKFKQTCSKCSVEEVYHVNDVYATEKHSLIFFILTFLAIIVLFVFLHQYITRNDVNIQVIYLVPIGCAIPLITYSTISNNQKKSIKAFNKYKTK